jgi:hypothetical protein
MTIDLRAWALHDAVYHLARESGLDSFRVECKHGPEGETVIALVLDAKRAEQRPAAPARRPR